MDAADTVGDGRHLAMFTVDVEPDWAAGGTRGVEEAVPALLEVLRASGATATFFVVAEIAEKVREVLPPEGPDEVGSHSSAHPLLTSLPDSAVRAEVVDSKSKLEALGYAVSGFRAPFNRFPRSLPALLLEAGYRYDASIGPRAPFLRRCR